MTIEAINALTPAGFVEKLGWIFEDSPWVAERAQARRPFRSHHELLAALITEVESASKEEQLALLRAHPDLGARARMGDASANEQSNAGLDRLSTAQYSRLTDLNEAYKLKFGFPFLYAVRGSTIRDILEALERRSQAAPEGEFQEALRQVFRIARFRLETI